MIATTARIIEVCIDHPGGQISLKVGRPGEVRGPSGPISIADVPHVLTSNDGWIEYETIVEFESDEDEPWRGPGSEPDRRATARLYARSVSQVMLVYDGPISPE